MPDQHAPPSPLSDRYTLALIFGIIALAAFILFVTSKSASAIRSFGVFAFVSVSIFLLAAFSSARVLRNNAPQLPWCYKGEDTPIADLPDTNTDIDQIPIDGIAYPGMTNEQGQPAVFKAVTGSDVYIDSDGKVHNVGIGSAIMNALGGGGYRTDKIDDTWVALRNCAFKKH